MVMGFVAVADIDTKLCEFTSFIALLGNVESEKNPSIFAKVERPRRLQKKRQKEN